MLKNGKNGGFMIVSSKIFKREIVMTITLALAILGSVLLINNHAKTTKNILITNLEQLHQRIEKVHSKALKGIAKEFNIPKDEWQATMTAFSQFAAKNDLLRPFSGSYTKTDDPIANRVKKSLAQAGINPAKVEICYIDNPECTLVARQECDNEHIWHYIDINKQWLQKRSEAVQKAILAHEIEHLKHFDSIESAFIIELLAKYGHTFDDYDKSKAVKSYRHSREYRADLLAAARDVSIAKALQDDLKTLADTKYPTTNEHPAALARYNQVSLLVKNMHENQPKIA